MEVPYITVSQPIGTFYMCSLNAQMVLDITYIKHRSKGEGVQRDESKKRVKEILNYADKDPDATFPTPIIVSVDELADFQIESNFIVFNENTKIGSVLDGQHRLLGLEGSKNISLFELPVFFMIGLNEEERAYIFSIINSKQTKVPNSIIYDLFELSQTRSPQKTVHDIARLFNSDENSPFFKRLKMLGKKEGTLTSLSQASFSKEIIQLISKRPDEDLLKIKNNEELLIDERCPFRKYFIAEDDVIIYKILFNIFSAVKEVFQHEWNNPDDYILTKPVGFAGIVRAIPEMFNYGHLRKNLKKDFFIIIFRRFKDDLKKENLSLTSKDFSSNSATSNKIAKMIKSNIYE